MNPKIKYLFLSAFFFLMILPDFSYAQIGPPNNKEEYEKMYNRRIRQRVLNRVYIPKDMAEAFNELNKKIDDDSKLKFKTVPEEIAARKLHFSLGRWMITHWSFYEGSRFSHYLKKIGITHPDDMARFTIRTYHRHLNKKSLDVKPLIVEIKERRKKEADDKRSGGEVIHEEKRIRPKN